LADRANEYIAEQEPWQLAKQEGKEQEVQNVCSMGIHLFRLVMIYLTPVVPKLSADAQLFLNDNFTWESAQITLTGHKINKFKALMQRVPTEKIESMLEASKDSSAATVATTNGH
jgi:methionyl-tRNA synthetase